MFKPIIHNLGKEHPGFGAVMKYNMFCKLGKAHFTRQCATLAQKIQAERNYKAFMQSALKDAQNFLNTEAYKVHTGYTPSGRDKWKRFDTLQNATLFCSEVFNRCGIVLTIVKR